MDDEIDFLETEEDKNKRKEVVLSDKEKEKIKQAMKEMEENMTQPQHVVGKSFSGAGFASKPEKIIYKDFEIGVPMTITVEITNISLGFNSFKLLPLDDEIIDFFDIKYTPAGRLPAGISTHIIMKFTPMVDKDYFSHLKLLSETGMCKFPIECLHKKCVINIQNSLIDYGEIIIGQQVLKHFNLENEGAIPCVYDFLDKNEYIYFYKIEFL